MASDPKRVQELFLQLVELPPDERPAALARECGDDAELRQRVGALLRAHDEPGSILGQPAGAATMTYQPHTEPGKVVAGRYTLVEKIGEGGMGEVWVARQNHPVKRKVAIKFIKPGMDSKAVLTRFEQERQALAMMEHPNIARVFDAGMSGGNSKYEFRNPKQIQSTKSKARNSEEAAGYEVSNFEHSDFEFVSNFEFRASDFSTGCPFFAMEVVNGLPLTKFCDDARLTPRERLELFIPICQAVQHAHQKGIVHRDLKPSNILVTLIDGKPVPKVIDFGVAKAIGGRLTEESFSTQFGAVIGTLEYMSPEQAAFSAIDVDTRSDIYSLGVILYELLTGLRPFDAKRLREAALDEMARILREEEPSRPSTRLSTDESLPSIAALRQTEPKKLMSLMRGELDWIVMKCLEKGRDRRYETASALGRDVERYLADEPVEVRPPSTVYRAGKFLRRNKGPVLAASLVLVALSVGTVAATLGLIEANRQAKIARTEAAEAERARQAEAAQKTRALQAAQAERMAKEQAQKRLGQIEKANEVLGSIFRDLDPREAERLGKPLQAVLGERLDQATAQLEGDAVGDPLSTARLQSTLAESQLNLGYAKRAIALFTKARETLEAQLGAEHPDTLRSMDDLATAFHHDGQLDKAVPLFEQALQFRRTKLGPDHPDTLASMNNLARAYHDAGQFEKAISLLEEALLRIRKAQGPLPVSVLTTTTNLALAYQEAGQFDKALPLLEETLRLKRELFGPGHHDTIVAANNLATAYHAVGRSAAMLPLLEETLTLAYEKLGREHPVSLDISNNLAAAYEAVGQPQRAIPLFEETLRIRKAKLDADHPDTLMSLNNLAFGYMSLGEHERALPLLEEALNRQQVKLGPDHPETLLIQGNLAICYKDAGQLERAIALFETTLERLTARLGPEHPTTLTLMNNLADAYENAGQMEKALPLMERTLALAEAKLGSAHRLTLMSIGNLAVWYWRANDLDRSIPLFERALEAQRKLQGENHPDTLRTQVNLGINYRDAGRLAEATALLEQAYAQGKRNDSQQIVGKSLVATYVKGAIQAKGSVGQAALLAPSGSIRSHSGGNSVASPQTNGTSSVLRDKAIRLLDELLQSARRELPAASPQLASELAEASLSLLELGAYVEAEKLLVECLSIREPQHAESWLTFHTKSLLGGAVLGQQKHAEAEPLLLAGYHGMHERQASIPESSRARITEAIQRLVDLYTAWNKPAEVEKWKSLLGRNEP